MPRRACDEQRQVREVVGRVRRRPTPGPCSRAALERRGHVGLLHEAEAGDDAVEAVLRACSTSIACSPDRRSARRRSTPSAGRPARAAPCCASGGARGSAARPAVARRHEDAGARNADRRLAPRRSRRTRRAALRSPPGASRRAARPVCHVVMTRVDDSRPTSSGNQPPCSILMTLAPKNARSISEKRAGRRSAAQPQRSSPSARARRRTPASS